MGRQAVWCAQAGSVTGFPDELCPQAACGAQTAFRAASSAGPATCVPSSGATSPMARRAAAT